MFHRSIRRADHVRRYSIVSNGPSGWEVTLEEDRTLRHRACYRDWHRVERALALFEREVRELTEQGWRLDQTSCLEQTSGRPGL